MAKAVVEWKSKPKVIAKSVMDWRSLSWKRRSKIATRSAMNLRSKPKTKLANYEKVMNDLQKILGKEFSEQKKINQQQLNGPQTLG
jgi:hypothetical protein